MAIKVQHAGRSSLRESALARREARILASLDHPHIVPCYHCGQQTNGRWFLVCRWIDGQNLAALLRRKRPSPQETAAILAPIAEALHHAHRQKMIHRDVKPANILIDSQGDAFITDFGVALTGDEFDDFGFPQGGTIAYMSPEQARREGHRIDGRSDIFSLGVVLYEMLTGERPFAGRDAAGLLEQIRTLDIRPPRQLNDSIPLELERICLKALAKRTSDRYTTALDMAEELRHVIARPLSVGPRARPQVSTTAMVPRGLRAFDQHDASFFLDLLPGPRDASGLPDAVRFWTDRIEASGDGGTFTVGVLYGPSGCGKSSLIKAGVIPQLNRHVTSIYVEANDSDTASLLHQRLQKAFRELPKAATLSESIRWLRYKVSQGAGRKLCIFLDQFEQHLHGTSDERSSKLIDALRQCDGQHVQCVLLVRDDFWTPITRFMRELDVRIVEGENSLGVDLFPLQHAEDVLVRFGRAHQLLPHDELTGEQQSFVSQAVRELAVDERVVCVRLALFAEMMKHRSWEASSLAAVGGFEGLGVKFLDETFSIDSAKPEYRRHEKAIRVVLESLLPADECQIKSGPRSREQLREAITKNTSSVELDKLLSILDRDLKLITPVDVPDESGGESLGSQQSQRYYQLTHDYLVPSIREWIKRRRRATRRGRAELRLAERVDQWNGNRRSRQLPSWWEDLSIRVCTNRKTWTSTVDQMMRHSGRYHGLRLILLLAVLGALAWIRLESTGRSHARAIATALDSAQAQRVPALVASAQGYHRWLDPLLHQATQNADRTEDALRRELNARIALMNVDPAQWEPLVDALLRDDLHDLEYVGVICQALQRSKEDACEKLWELFGSSDNHDTQFRAGLALAQLEPDAARWRSADVAFLVGQLLAAPPETQPRLRSFLSPIKEHLLPELSLAIGGGDDSERRQLGAAQAIAEFASDDVERLNSLLLESTTEQYKILFKAQQRLPHAAVHPQLKRLVAGQPQAELGRSQRITHGRRKASAAITLLRRGELPSALGVFRMVDDPEALTQFVHACRGHGVTSEELLECLQMVGQDAASKGQEDRLDNASIVYGLLLALGHFSLEDLPESEQLPTLERLVEWYAHHPSSAVHSASGWLLRQWGNADLARSVDESPQPYVPNREWFTLRIPIGDAEATAGEPLTSHLTFIVFAAGEYHIGTPDVDARRERARETHHRFAITRPFAVADREINFAEMIAFDHAMAKVGRKLSRSFSEAMKTQHLSSSAAAMGVTWHDAVGFCDWLTDQAKCADDPTSSNPGNLLGSHGPGAPQLDSEHFDDVHSAEVFRPGLRLPTEHEWEIACRGGMGTLYGFGSDGKMLRYYGWFLDNSRNNVCVTRGLRPNTRGVFDMHGNVREWCFDWYGEHYPAPDAVDPVGPPDGRARVVRGGFWRSYDDWCRSALRGSGQPDSAGSLNGFRMALTLPTRTESLRQPSKAPLEEFRSATGVRHPGVELSVSSVRPKRDAVLQD